MAAAIDRSTLRVPTSEPAAEHLAWRLCKLCDIKDWQTPGFAALASDIMVRKPGHVFEHRKLWEFTQTVHALDSLGLWNRRAVGLSVAGGHERVLFYATHHLARIVATDIYGQGEFNNEADAEADRQFLERPEIYAPYPYEQERLKPLYMDALDLKFESNTFDFSYSLSSIEHFGGLEKAITALREMERVTKPGGAVVLVTECVLNGNNGAQFFLPEELLRLVSSTRLRLVENIDWSLSDQTLQYLIDMHSDDLNTTPHLNLFASGSLFTSICLVLMKPADLGVALLGSDLPAIDAVVDQLKADPSL